MISIIKRVKQYDNNILIFIVFDIVIMVFSLVTAYISPLVYQKFIDDCLMKKNYLLIKYVFISYLALWIIGSISSFVRNAIEKKQYIRLKLKISSSLFDKGMHTNQFSSVDIKDRTESDIYCHVLSKIVIEKIYNYLLIIGSLSIMLYLNVWFTFIAIISVPLAKLILKIVQKKLVLYSQEYRSKYVNYENSLKECISLRDHIRANHNEDYVEKIFDTHWTKLAQLYMKKQICFVIQYCLNEFTDTYVIKLNLYFLGFFFISQGYITVGILLAFMKYYEMCISTYAKINELNATNATLKPYIDMTDDLHNIPVYCEKSTKVNSKVLSIKNVSFAFDNTKIINHFNLLIKPGEHVLISGKSGVGKTTFLNLLAGVYKPTEGTILIGDTSINELGYSKLAKIRSVVQQNSYFFRISVMDNLRLANTNVTENEIRHICKITGCDEFISEIENKYDTVINNNFSAGQLQRLAIARAIIQNTDILLFDEPTSALDKINEKIFLQLLESILLDKTVITISHTLKHDKMIEYKLRSP